MTVLDLVLIYAIPIGVLIIVWLLVSLAITVGVRSPIGFDFKRDLLRKFEEKRSLPSGRERLSYAYVAKLLIGDNCVQAAFLYRISRFLTKRKARSLAEAVHAFAKFVTHVDISPYAEIGPGLYIYHGMGAVVGKGTRIGERALICQGVTLGGGPQIGNDVTIWAGAKVHGKISIGDRAQVGANAVVLDDVPADHLAVGVPALRLIPKGAASPAGASARVVSE